MNARVIDAIKIKHLAEFMLAHVARDVKQICSFFFLMKNHAVEMLRIRNVFFSTLLIYSIILIILFFWHFYLYNVEYIFLWHFILSLSAWLALLMLLIGCAR